MASGGKLLRSMRLSLVVWNRQSKRPPPAETTLHAFKPTLTAPRVPKLVVLRRPKMNAPITGKVESRNPVDRVGGENVLWFKITGGWEYLGKIWEALLAPHSEGGAGGHGEANGRRAATQSVLMKPTYLFALQLLPCSDLGLHRGLPFVNTVVAQTKSWPQVGFCWYL